MMKEQTTAMWPVALAACGVELALDVLCVSWAAMIARNRRKSNAADSLDHTEHVPGQPGPPQPAESNLQSEGLPVFAQLLALGMCLLGFNSLLAEPRCLLAQLADLVQALAWGMVLLLSSWTYQCQLEAPDLSPQHPGRQQQRRHPPVMELSLVQTQRIALHHRTGEGVQRFPLARSLPLLALWTLRAAASWARGAESIAFITGGDGMAEDYICTSTAVLMTLFAATVSAVCMHSWFAMRHGGRRGLERLYSMETASSFGAWAAARAHASGSRTTLNKTVLEGSGLLNHLCFTWVTPLMDRGAEGPLSLSDLFRLPLDLRPQVCANRLWESWARERRRAKAAGPEHKPRFLRACVVAFSGPLAWLGVLKAATVALSFAGPLLLKQLLTLLIEEVGPEGSLNPSSIRTGFFLVSSLTGSCLTMAILQAQCVYQQGRVCCQLRSALTSCLYRKALCISKAEIKSATLGEAKSITSTHVEELVGLFSSFHDAWSIPLTILIGLVILYHQVRFACLPGFFLMVVVVWANRVLATKMKAATESLSAVREERIGIMAEVLQNIPQIKVSALEDIYFRKVSGPRDTELRHVRQGHRLNALKTFLADASGVLFSVSILATYAMMGGMMRADIVFTCLALFHVLADPINGLPWAVVSWRKALSCTRKLRRFMTADEAAASWAYGPLAGEAKASGWALLCPKEQMPQPWHNPPPPQGPAAPRPSQSPSTGASPLLRRGRGFFRAPAADTPPQPLPEASVPLLRSQETAAAEPESHIEVEEAGIPEDSSIFLQEASFSSSSQSHTAAPGQQQQQQPGGGPDPEDFVLEGLNLKVQTGTLCCVLGGSHSGKSRLLQALRGELCCLEGWGATRGRLSCATLDPYLIPGSFRENILFGEAFEAARYAKVIAACQLSAHLRLLPQNDETVISNSGSAALTDTTKAKLSLARALYKAADVYLFEDVWSSMDVETAQGLVALVLQGELLEGKTRLVATDLYGVMQVADQMVWMRDGRINQDGAQTPVLQDSEQMSGDEEAALSRALHQIKSSQRTHRREASAQDLVDFHLDVVDPEGCGSPSNPDHALEASCGSFGDIVGPHFTTSAPADEDSAADAHPSTRSSMASSSPSSPVAHLFLLGERRSHSLLNRTGSDKGPERPRSERLSGESSEAPSLRCSQDLFSQAHLGSSTGSLGSLVDLEPVSPFEVTASSSGTAPPGSAAPRRREPEDTSSPRALTALAIEHEADGSLKIIDESREDCNVSSSTYLAYFQANGIGFVVLGALGTALMLGAQTALELWIAAWVTYSHSLQSHNDNDHKAFNNNNTFNNNINFNSIDTFNNSTFHSTFNNSDTLSNSSNTFYNNTFDTFNNSTFHSTFNSIDTFSNSNSTFNSTYNSSSSSSSIHFGEEVPQHETHHSLGVLAEALFPLSHLSKLFRLNALLVITAVAVAFTAGRAWTFSESAQIAARRMHERMLKTTIGMPLSFFTTMPTSRILGRFSTDVAAIDETLPRALNLLTSKLAKCLSISAVLVFVEPWLLLGLVPMAVALYCLQRTYRPSSMEMMRLAAASLSYAAAQGMEAIEGGPAVRAQGAQEVFQLQQYLVMGDVQRSAMAQLAVSQWLAVRLKVAAALIAGAVGGIAIADLSDVLPGNINWNATIGLIGLSLTYTLPAAELLGSLLSSSMDTAQGMMSAERMSEFASLVSEQELDRIHIRSTIPRLLPGKRPMITPGMVARKSPDWPRHGEVLFENVTLHYENTFTPALDHLTLAIPAGTKVGIVGRTAAGKSSLLGALLRLWPLSGGRIRIDGLDVRELPVRRLRFVVDVLPQQPFLFLGSVRENIDPYSRFSDGEIKAALQTTQLWETLRFLALFVKAPPAAPGAAPQGLGHGQSTDLNKQEPESTVISVEPHQGSITDAEVLTAPIIGHGGLTPHQAQLLALVRILLRGPRIVCLDEATAAVDPHTASLMSKAMRAYLARSTCLQVAHRLDDVMSCSSVVVMAAGRVVERGDPNLLLQNPRSHFAVLHSYHVHHKPRAAPRPSGLSHHQP